MTRPADPPMTAAACPSCGQPVLHAGTRVLTPQPTRLGIYDPTSGEAHSSSHIAQLVRDTGHAGHGNHTCPTPQQGGLFDQQEAS